MNKRKKKKAYAVDFSEQLHLYQQPPGKYEFAHVFSLAAYTSLAAQTISAHL